MSPRPLPALALALFAAAAFARDLPNYDASTLLRVEPSASVRAAAARANGGAKIPTEWYPQYGTPSFVWVGGSADVAMASVDDNSSAYVSEVHDIGRGPIIVRYRQRIDGIDVFRNEMNVVMTRDHRVIAMSGHLARRAEARPTTAMAATAAPESLFCVRPEVATDVVLGEIDGGRILRNDRVWFDLGTSLEPAYHIEVEDDEGMMAYVISAADGRLLFRKNLTEDAGQPFTYRVWADAAGTHRPLNGPQGFGGDPNPTGTNDGFQAPMIAPSLVTLINGPMIPADPWLAASATVTTGNNVDAYADLNPPTGFSTGDVRAAVSAPFTFDYTYDVAAQPNASTTQRMASVVQLFYDVNWLHDWFYDSGFTEAARNAQTDNYGRGGLGGDPIRAEAQDYSGRNNANMSTPSDGNRPTMQMFVFDAITFHALDVDSPAPIAARYGVGVAQFGTQSFNLSGDVVATTPADGCGVFTSNVTGKIAFVNRGTCTFTTKSQNAKSAGAIGIIVGNVADSVNPTSYVRMACSATACTTAEQNLIPSLQVPLATADAFRAQLAASGSFHATLRRDAGVDRDGGIDNSIVAHEWAHYLSNRLVGNSVGLATNQARGMGEGWSDFNALLLMARPEDVAIASNATYNGAFPLAAYVEGGGGNGAEPNGGFYFGIRRVPYSTDMAKNPLTLKHIGRGAAISGAPVAFGDDGGNNFEVHATGEVWATMLWECYAALLRDTLGENPRLTFVLAQKRMRDYLVASLKITPNDPTFLDARNALLAAAYATDPRDFDAFFHAFAKRGAGIRAAIAERYSIINAGVTEDFTVGADAAVSSIAIDDSITSCKNNGILEGNESGLLTVTVRNTGDAHLGANVGSTRAHVTADDARLIIDNGGNIDLPPSDPGKTVTGTVKVSLLDNRSTIKPTITVTLTDPDFVAGAAVFSAPARLNAHDEPKQSASDDVESRSSAWLPSNLSRWSVAELTPLDHVWQANERFNSTDASLTSPMLAVSRSKPLRISFAHRYWFDATTGTNGETIALDGGVVELSTDNGTTWTDIGSLAQPGYGAAAIAGGNANPLETRHAFVGLSTGATLETPSAAPFITSVIDLGTAYAGQWLRIRFRYGTANAHTGLPLLGWQIDDVVLSGIDNLPFTRLVPDTGVCGIALTSTTMQQSGPLLHVTVTSSLGTPTGTVELSDGGRVYAALPLVGGAATFDPSLYFTAGAHTIMALYAGTTNFQSSSSPLMTINVAPPPKRHATH